MTYDKCNSIFIEVSVMDLKEIEKIPGFLPIYMYSKLSEIHLRSWGFMVVDKTEYFFRVDLNQEKLFKINNQAKEIMLRLSSTLRMIEKGDLDFDDFKGMAEKCISACGLLLTMYKDNE